jgi:hypothetical protein
LVVTNFLVQGTSVGSPLFTTSGITFATRLAENGISESTMLALMANAKDVESLEVAPVKVPVVAPAEVIE